MASYEITSKSELKTQVRDTTLYENSATEGLSDSELESAIERAQLTLDNRGGNTNWYSDTGMMQALLYSSCIEAKAAVENYSVDRWDVVRGEIDVSGAGDSDQVQFQRWARLVSEGLDAATDTSGQYPTNVVNNSYIG